ncbi:hypothetical protein GH714_018416 [Hevea brasiliensis]|uniref:Choline monooxygenase, chloroplastic n=1 Tax=Hevea brasiliensis TaxID=3981 RepID=A0A6A6MUK4_HEVBR|nr:hypothetical protein GH714_018416 [Hevea brasiliensis]
MAIATAVIPLKLITSSKLQPKNHTPILAQNRPFKVLCCFLHNPSSLHTHCQKLVDEFDPRIPMEKALTPPSSWYTDPSFYDYELHRVFYGGWQAVGYTEQIKDPRDFFTGRYGPWMDTDLVLPLGPMKCQVIFDYFVEAYHKDDKAFIERSLADSERVQIEDIMLCEGVQRGLESPAYCSGRYAPTVAKAMQHFHQLLQDIKM